MKYVLAAALIVVVTAAQATPVHLACAGRFKGRGMSFDGDQSITVDTQAGTVTLDDTTEIPILGHGIMETGDVVLFNIKGSMSGSLNRVTGELLIVDSVHPERSFLGTCKPVKKLF